MSRIIKKQFGDNLEFKHPICKDCRGNTFTIEISEHDSVLLHCVRCLNTIDFQIINRKACCKFPDYCGGECTCKICAPDLHIERLECDLVAEKSRTKQLEKGYDELRKVNNRLSSTADGLKNYKQRILDLEADKKYWQDKCDKKNAEMFDMTSALWETKAERDEAIKVLKNIADPMEYIKSYAEKSDSEINHEYAIKFANSADCLKGLAKDFLTNNKQ